MIPAKPISSRIALVISMIVLILSWHLAAESLNRSFLPNPVEVLQTFLSEMQNALPNHILVSTRRVLVSVLIGTLTAAPLAIFAAQFRLLDMFLSPLIYFAYPAPKIVFLPIIILILGLGDSSMVFLISLIIFFQVYVIVRDAAAQVPPQTLDSVRSLGAKGWQLLRYVYLPMSIPAVITALKISVGTAIAVLFIAESIGNQVGLGYYIIVEQWNRFAYEKVYAGILAMSLLGLFLFVSLNILEKRLNRWQK